MNRPEPTPVARPGRAPGVRVRTGLLLVILLGIIAPLGLVGLWLTRSTQRSAEALVQARQEATLSGIVPVVARSWVTIRGDLLDLSQDPSVQLALSERLDPAPTGMTVGPLAGRAARSGVVRVWERLAGAVDRVEFRDVDGQLRGWLERDSRPGPLVDPALLARIPVRLDVHASDDGARIGFMDAWVRAGALLPANVLLPGLGGSVLALFDPAAGESILPLPMDADLFAHRRFGWADERWVVARRHLHEPPLVIALAGPVGPVAGPLAEAAGHGSFSLLLVTLTALALTLLVSRWLARPMGRLVAAADGVAAGRLDGDVPEAGPAEMHQVARAFNTMTASLRATLERLSQQEALVAMGQLAASIAHEVRNPLSAIRLDLERASERMDPQDPARRLTDRALRDVDRLDASVTNTLRLARAGRLSLERVELCAPVQAAVQAARPAFREKEATLHASSDAGAGIKVEADSAALEQLFLNLLLNAAEALGPGGVAGIEVGLEGDEGRVVVWDRGSGMAPAVMARVLEPFFSTRPEGTGLGLAIAHRIVRSHSGTVEFSSEPGQGTTVTVRLPVTRNDPTDGTGTDRSDPGASMAAAR